MNTIKIPKYGYIDALRGIAILGVLMVHVNQKIIPDGGFITVLMGQGDKGVQLFFLVSALTLCFSLDFRKNNETNFTLNFFIRRFFRIAPLFYLAILYYQISNGFHANYYAPNGIKWWHILSAATFTNGWHPETLNSVVPGNWSLAIEFTFYLFLPLLFRILNNKEKAIIFVIFSSILAYYMNWLINDYWGAIYSRAHYYLVHDLCIYGFFNQLPVFAAGILLFHVFKNHVFNHKIMTSLTFVLLSLFIFISVITFYSYDNFISQLLMVAISFSCLTYAMANHKMSFFNNAFTRFLGKISFSIYLVHFAILNKLGEMDFFNGLEKYKTEGTFIAFAITGLLAVAVSIVTYELIEKNGIRLGKIVIEKINKRRIAKES